MGRRLRLVDRPRYTVPAPQCVVKPCHTTPQPGTLVCVFHARALQKLTEETGQ